jgi:hypothetical protein
VALQWWPAPEAGEIVWCVFPENRRITPGPKPRPALVMTVFEDDAPHFVVKVAYGTSKKISPLRSGEFVITDIDAAAYKLAGLSFNTKFSFHQCVELPFNSDWFKVPPSAAHGQTPKLGVLHPSLMQRVRAAWEAAQ